MLCPSILSGRGTKCSFEGRYSSVFQCFRCPETSLNLSAPMCPTKAFHYCWPFVVQSFMSFSPFIYTQMFDVLCLFTSYPAALHLFFSHYKIYSDGLIILTSMFSTPTLRVLCELNILFQRHSGVRLCNRLVTGSPFQAPLNQMQKKICFECDGCGLSFMCVDLGTCRWV